MDTTYPQESWDRLGELLRLRRGQLGWGYGKRGAFLAARHGTMSEKMLARIERGERGGRWPADTLAAIEALYGWEPGSVTRVLAGGEPVIADGPVPAMITEIAGRYGQNPEEVWSSEHVRAVWHSPRWDDEAREGMVDFYCAGRADAEIETDVRRRRA